MRSHPPGLLLFDLDGVDLNGRFDDKGDLIAHLLEHEAVEASQGCMIGDRENDTRAAARNGMPSIGVLWGYGNSRELLGGGATALCSHPDELPCTIRLVA